MGSWGPVFAFCWREMGHAAVPSRPPPQCGISLASCLSSFLPRGSVQSNHCTVAFSSLFLSRFPRPGFLKPYDENIYFNNAYCMKLGVILNLLFIIHSVKHLLNSLFCLSDTNKHLASITTQTTVNRLAPLDIEGPCRGQSVHQGRPPTRVVRAGKERRKIRWRERGKTCSLHAAKPRGQRMENHALFQSC